MDVNAPTIPVAFGVSRVWCRAPAPGMNARLHCGVNATKRTTQTGNRAMQPPKAVTLFGNAHEDAVARIDTDGPALTSKADQVASRLEKAVANRRMSADQQPRATGARNRAATHGGPRASEIRVAGSRALRNDPLPPARVRTAPKRNEPGNHPAQPWDRQRTGRNRSEAGNPEQVQRQNQRARGPRHGLHVASSGAPATERLPCVRVRFG